MLQKLRSSEAGVKPRFLAWRQDSTGPKGRQCEFLGFISDINYLHYKELQTSFRVQSYLKRTPAISWRYIAWCLSAPGQFSAGIAAAMEVPLSA